MNYRCPKCQSTKIVPLASSTSARPIIPKSLIVLVPSILLLLLLVFISIIILVMGKKAGMVLQAMTIVSFLSCVVSGFLFWRVLPDFKISMQNFMQAQKHWKCRQCSHEWQN
ncbi:MAG: hypothetical protein E6Q25_03595 [Acinetobacter sp.]|nr:MAG: hypothetical protein E6Q25_03595 [Acinetobacter sp.]